jgi:ferrous iron transport protein B
MPEALRAPVAKLSRRLRSTYPHLENPDWIALRLLEGDPRIAAALQNGEFEQPRTAAA